MKTEQRTPVLVDGIRSPMGRHGGVLSGVRPDDLMARLLSAMQDRHSFDPAQIDDVLIGCNNQSGEDSRNVARIASILADIPFSVPGQVVNRQCASSMETVVNASLRVRTGNGHIYMAGGVESMSRGPYVMKKPESGFPLGSMELHDSVIGFRFKNPRLDAYFEDKSLGETAEVLAEEYDISREEQDRFSLRSHQNAVEAHERGRFDPELIPVERPDGELVDRDENPRPDTSMEKLSSLPPAFTEDGTVTAGSSSPLTDGAALCLVMSETKARDLGFEEYVRLVSYGLEGVHPNRMGIGPVPATREALEKTDLTLDQMELVELNEAFAAQSLAVLQDLEVPENIVNPNGGAIALGHPLGCSGSRIITTLIHEMSRRDAEYGLATMCVGLGQGMSTIWRRVTR